MKNPLLALSKKSRLWIAIGIFLAFFVVELAIGFYTRSLALVADAFHVCFDLLSFAIALTAIIVSEKGKARPQGLSFGWQRAQLLGSFFNGVFQLALGFSIFLLSLERFIYVEYVEKPQIILIVACTGLASNLVTGAILGVHEHSHDHGPGTLDLEHLTAHQDLGHRHHIKIDEKTGLQKFFSHDHSQGQPRTHSHAQTGAIDLEEGKRTHAHDHGHDHDHGRAHSHSRKHHHDLGTKAVLIHLMGDAFNNVGVIISAIIIWKSSSPHRFYADPVISMVIGIVLIATAYKLVCKGGRILLLSEPIGVDVADVQHDLERVPGVVSIHELHLWRLNEEKSCATAHVVVDDSSLDNFQGIAKIMNECLHAYGIHSTCLQPEIMSSVESPERSTLKRAKSGCGMNCGSTCAEKSCCG